jgi:hypothetical protein
MRGFETWRHIPIFEICATENIMKVVPNVVFYFIIIEFAMATPEICDPCQTITLIIYDTENKLKTLLIYTYMIEKGTVTSEELGETGAISSRYIDRQTTNIISHISLFTIHICKFVIHISVFDMKIFLYELRFFCMNEKYIKMQRVVVTLKLIVLWYMFSMIWTHKHF